MSSKSRIALWQGPERSENLRASLRLVMDEIDWSTRSSVVVKPNLVSPYRPDGNTHIDALRVVLEEVRSRYSGAVSVAEGCARRSTLTVFHDVGFEAVANAADAQLVDLNTDEAGEVSVFDRHGNPLSLRVARTVLESDCRISLAIPKTHDYVMLTLGIKNMVMGSMVNRAAFGGLDAGPWPYPSWQETDEVGQGGNDKDAMHQGYPMMHANLALVARHVLPHLTVLDGFVGMEGRGPAQGDPVPWKIAIAGTDALAVDAFTAGLMGFDVQEVGYLAYCRQIDLGRAEPGSTEIIGNAEPDAVRRAFTRHPTQAEQNSWHDPRVQALLSTAVAHA